MKIIKQDFREVDYSIYSTLIIDPPWNYEDNGIKALENQICYSRWSNQEGLSFIFNLPADYLFIWSTNSMIEELLKFPQEKFIYKQIFTWVKLTKNNKLAFGLGNNFRNCTEQLLLFVRKSKKLIKPLRLNIRNVILAQSGLRTEKPKEFELFLVKLLEERFQRVAYIFSGPNINCFKDTEITVIDSCL